MSRIRPKVGVVVFPGSNDDRDAAWALTALGAAPMLVWHADDRLPPLDAIVLPGGFSYGDYLRCGAIARFAPAMRAVERSLRELGFPVSEARVGRVVDVEVDASTADEAHAKVERMCEQLLANPLIESYEIALAREPA